ncbi:hypothetical protein [Nonomuraea typhae]|uniref:hypothetical protein n=1 Tax=Nonomuraea typhae TaxID=2603600 RepID=UPI0012FCA2D5|nr:hypothetical protein [Nonomuraea typhae]
MTTMANARTARIPHLCASCHGTPNLRGVPTIAPGHRYVRHVAFPGDEVNQAKRPVSHNECIACAEERDPSAGLVVVGACSTFCCGDTPCALPFRHDSNHSCRRCINLADGSLREYAS